MLFFFKDLSSRVPLRVVVSLHLQSNRQDDATTRILPEYYYITSNVSLGRRSARTHAAINLRSNKYHSISAINLTHRSRQATVI